MQPRAIVATAFALAITAPLTAQQTLVVGGGGPFTTIASAIAAAAPGDTVLVQGGAWQEVLDIDKGIRLIGRGATFVPPLFPAEPIVIHDVPAGQVCVVAGFEPDPGRWDVTVRVADCDGTVCIRELGMAGLLMWRVLCNDSAQVDVEGCVLRFVGMDRGALDLVGCVVDQSSFWAMSLTDARAAIVASTVHSGGGFASAPAILVTGGQLALTRSDVFPAGGSHPAISATDATILVDPSTTLSPTGGQPSIAGTFVSATFEFASQAAWTDGQLLTLETHGSAGAPFLTMMSLPAPETATPYGLAWIDPNGWAPVTAATFPVTRLHTATLAHPTLPPGFTVAVQTAWLSPTGLALSTPSLVVAP